MSAVHAAIGGMTAALGVGMTMVGRTWPTPSGLRRSRLVSDDTLLDELLGPTPVYGAVVGQGWRWCPSCCRNEPSVLHADGSWTCGHCFEPTVPTTAGSPA